jgi:SRSO17 transposase
MGLGSELEHADRFAAYVNELTKALMHADREKPFRDYCAGLLATEGRRGVEPARPFALGRGQITEIS